MSNTLTFFRNKFRYQIFLWLGANQEKCICYVSIIAREMNVHYTSLNYHITKIKEEGLIDSNLRLTKEGIRIFKFLWENENKTLLRAHNIQIVFKLDKCPYDFPNCFSREIYKPFSNNRYKGIQTTLNNMEVMFYSEKKIVCVLPDIYADNDEEISSAVQLEIPKIKKILEDEFNGIGINDYKIARIQTMSVAILNSIYAKTVALKGFTYEGKNIAVDVSDTPELELTNSLNCLRDIDMLMKLENDFAIKQTASNLTPKKK